MVVWNIVERISNSAGKKKKASTFYAFLGYFLLCELDEKNKNLKNRYTM